MNIFSKENNKLIGTQSILIEVKGPSHQMRLVDVVGCVGPGGNIQSRTFLKFEKVILAFFITINAYQPSVGLEGS